MAIVHWGDVHMVDERGRPKLHEHKKCGKMFDPVMVCSECGEPLMAREVHVASRPRRQARCRRGAIGLIDAKTDTRSLNDK